MQHNENDKRRRGERTRREAPPYNDRYFNDFRSRWGEPSPSIELHQYDWQPREVGRFPEEGRYHQHRDEWLPNQRRQQAPRPSNQQYREPIWRQQDVHFDRSNQRAEDRWYQDPLMPHPDKRRRRRQGPPDQHWE
ncbi:hypothetical protein CLV24_11765 [Pontibacter ummariensis]|uniref:Uncharacterized protein n=1 Tax=Pontibacter ummariensis TaxID=1610492 RepID=A0A239II87_9BACT|nr:hypothetical protein [Pontibacter ummariensis]PRY09860.1 hypothetical protein CLV24_11765 [Pontibacter ummariensis]SNS93239.1 hypothetical protein SAMN06296052_11765 [Pontibacter ummariensis]